MTASPLSTPQPITWPGVPQTWSFSSLTTAEACPLKWAFNKATYEDGSRGFPERPYLKTLEGRVVHGAVEEVVKALAAAGGYPIDSEEGGAALMALGGVTEVVRRHVEEVLGSVPGNARTAPVIEDLARSLRRATPSLRDRVGPFIRRSPIRRGAGATRPSLPAGGEGPHAPSPSRRAPLGHGTHSEKRVQCADPRFLGDIDLISLSPGEVELVDFKTGEPKSAHADQLVAYGVVWLRDDQRNPDHRPATSLTVLYDATATHVPLPADWDVAGEALCARIRGMDAALQSSPPPANAGPDTCRFCPAKPACNAYWAADLNVLDPDGPGQSYVDAELVVTGAGGADIWSVSVVQCPSQPDLVGAGSLVVRNGPGLKTGQRLRVLGARRREPDDESPDLVPVLVASSWTEIFLVNP